MKHILLVLCTSIMGSTVAQTNHGIHFREDSLHILLQRAHDEHKLVFIDAYTSWCGPCKWMDANVFSNDTVGTFFNEHFISARIDMEKGEGKDIKKNYDVRCFPTFLFIHPNGELVHRESGAYPVEAFVGVGQKALDTVKRYGVYDALYASGHISASHFVQYVRMRESSCLDSKKIIHDYELSLNTKDLVGRDAWMLLNTVITSSDSRLLQYMVKHRSPFDAVYSADSVDMVLERIYLSVLYIGMRDSLSYAHARSSIQQLHLSIGEKILQKADVEWYLSKEDTTRFLSLVIPYMDTYGTTENYNIANNYAWMVWEYTQDVTALEKAVTWARYSVSVFPDYFNTDTYATLLFATGKLKEVKVWAQIAIMLAKEKGMEYGETQKLLDKIEGR